MTRPHSLHWKDLTREEIASARDGGAVVAIPVGSIEQHAAHLPVETDTRVSSSVTALAAERAHAVTVLVAPTLAFGFSPHHLSHAGTISLRLETYFAVLTDIARSIVDSGFTRVVFVNGHRGNSAPLRSKVAELVTDGIPVTAIDYWAPAEQEWVPLLKGALKRFGHACEFETSLMLALKSDDAAAVGRVLARIGDLAPRLMQPWIPPGHDSDPISEARAAWPPIFQADDAGYHGDPAKATVDAGHRLLDVLAGRLARFFEDFARTPLRFGTSRDPRAPLISPALIKDRSVRLMPAAGDGRGR